MAESRLTSTALLFGVCSARGALTRMSHLLKPCAEKRLMRTITKWGGFLAMASLTMLGLGSSPSAAQDTKPPATPPPGNRMFRVLPGESVNEAAKNAAMTAQALAAEDAYKDSPN